MTAALHDLVGMWNAIDKLSEEALTESTVRKVVDEQIAKTLKQARVEIAALASVPTSSVGTKCNRPIEDVFEEIRADTVREALESIPGIALEAFRAWDDDGNLRVGKILKALSGNLAGYRADIDAIHKAIAAPEPDAKAEPKRTKRFFATPGPEVQCERYKVVQPTTPTPDALDDLVKIVKPCIRRGYQEEWVSRMAAYEIATGVIAAGWHAGAACEQDPRERDVEIRGLWQRLDIVKGERDAARARIAELEKASGSLLSGWRFDFPPPVDCDIEIQYADCTTEVGQYRETRQCMLSSVAHGAGELGPGFVSKESGWLPTDKVCSWRPIGYAHETAEDWHDALRGHYPGYSGKEPAVEIMRLVTWAKAAGARAMREKAAELLEQHTASGTLRLTHYTLELFADDIRNLPLPEPTGGVAPQSEDHHD